MTNPSESRTIIVRLAADDRIDADGLALLFGKDVGEVRALPVVDGVVQIPREWMEEGRRRSSEAMAATGSKVAVDALRYWARRDHNAELAVVDVTGRSDEDGDQTFGYAIGE